MILRAGEALPFSYNISTYETEMPKPSISISCYVEENINTYIIVENILHTAREILLRFRGLQVSCVRMTTIIGRFRMLNVKSAVSPRSCSIFSVPEENLKK